MTLADRRQILGLAPFLMLLLSLTLLLVGCGAGGGSLPSPSGSSGSGSNGGSGSGGSGGGNGGTSSGSTAVLVNLGEFADVPDNIVAFELTIDSISLRSSSGGDVELPLVPRRIELSRLKAEPLLLSNVAQGKYRGVVIGFSNPKVSLIDSSGVLHENVAAAFNSSTATNPSEFSIGSTPMAINLNPVFGVSLGDGVVTVTPWLNFSTGGVPTKDLVARIIGLGSSSIWLDGDALPSTVDPGFYDGGFTYTTDSSTEFQGVNDLGGLTNGMTVEVDAVLGSGGTLHATRVKLESDPSEIVVEGLALDLDVAQLQMLVREVHRPSGVSLPEIGKALTVDTNVATQFHLEPADIDLNNLDFAPNFDALTIAPGQNVRVAAASGGATTVTANTLKLEKQSFDGGAGTVTASSVSGQYSLPLNLATDSAFAQLTGHTSVLVTLQPSTQKFLYFGLEDCVTCIAGGPVRVRGLLFFSGGQYRLVAEWLSVMAGSGP
jgi:Domain of unknown function (DUF5666)